MHGLKISLVAMVFALSAGVASAQTNHASVQQSGYDNAAGVIQTGSGLNANLSQSGNVNTVRVVQRGDSSSASVVQIGDNNALCLVQRGDNLNASFTQSGNQTGAYVQTEQGVRAVRWRQRCNWVPPAGPLRVSSTPGRRAN